MKGLDSKEIVVPSRWGAEKKKLWYQTKQQGSNFNRKKGNKANASSLSSEMSASLSFHQILVLRFKTL